MSPLSADARHEMRVARLLMFEGHFVRYGVGLGYRFGQDFTVTDVDVLALSFSSVLEMSTTVGQCKATEASSTLGAADRLLWSAGVRQLLGAQRSFLATMRPATPEMRRLADGLDALVMDERDLIRREAVAGITPGSPWGPLDERLGWQQARAQSAIRGDDELRHAFWFVRAEFWFMEPALGLKRALDALRLLGSRSSGGPPGPLVESVRWLTHQSLVCLTVAVVRLVGEALRDPPAVFTRRLVERVTEGAVDGETLRILAARADRHLDAELCRAGIHPAQAADRAGLLDPDPPPYTQPLVELIQRLASQPTVAAGLPRLLDWRTALLELGQELSPPPGQFETIGESQLQLIAAFVEEEVALPGELLVPLLELAELERVTSAVQAAHDDPVEATHNALVLLPASHPAPPAMRADGTEVGAAKARPDR